MPPLQLHKMPLHMLLFLQECREYEYRMEALEYLLEQEEKEESKLEEKATKTVGKEASQEVDPKQFIDDNADLYKVLLNRLVHNPEFRRVQYVCSFQFCDKCFARET
eukprot:m.27049 g.27049  ORF g.27049 m.27049 type:complete len:107 (+) comp9316_c0_seq4:1470-1790(+)